MKINIIDLIDFKQVDPLLEGFNQSTGFVTAILDLKGNVLSKSGWRQICTQFHRVHPATSGRCTISDTVLADELANGEKYHFYRCLNGLVDVAVPIVINGEHIANLFSGQFFFEQPEVSFFKKQAGKYGFNEKEYLRALAEVPVISKEKVKVTIDFLLNMTRLISDMTFQKLEQLQMNEVLSVSEKRSRNTLDHMLEGCQIIGYDWKYIYLNHTAEVHNRRPNIEMIGHRYQDMWPGIEHTEIFKIIEQVLNEKVSTHLENKFTFPDGSQGWFDLSIQPVPEGVFILSIDITERKKIENSLRESEEKYRLIADNSDDWIYWVAPEGHLLYVSPACERVTGYSPEEFINHPELNQEIICKADQEKVKHHAQLSKFNDSPHQLEFRIITKNGETRWISHSCNPIFNNDGVYLGQRGTNRNITERKQKEEQLFVSEFRFTKLFENGPFGMVIADKEFRFKRANPAFCNIMGYSEAEILEFTFKDITHPDDLRKDLPFIQKLIKKEIAVYRTEKRYFRKDGQMIWGSLSITATYDREGEFLYNLGIIEDITRRKQAEEELKQSKKLLSETESIGRVGGWEYQIDTMKQTWTDEVYRLHEVDFDYNINLDQGFGFYTPESRTIMEKAMQRVIDFGEPFDLELEIITAKGNQRKVHSIGRADTEHRRVYGFFQDITERKQLEESLQRNEARLRNIFEQANDGIFIIGNDNQFLDVNAKGTELLGYTREELLGMNISDVLHADEMARLEIEPQKLHSGIPHLTEWKHVRKDGSDFPGEVSARMLNNDSYLAIVRDLTDRKHAEKEITRLNERITTATRVSQVGIWDWDIKNNLLTWDDQMYTLYGLKNDQFAGAYEAWLNGLHPDDRDFSQNQTQLALQGKKEYDTEFRLIWPDESVRYIKAKGEVFRNEMGDPIRMIGINFDITEQKKIDEKIREKDLEFRKLSANVPDLIFQFTRKPDGSYFVPIASEGIRNIFGCVPEDVADSFVPIGRVIFPEDAERVIRDIEYSAEHLSYFTCEFRVQIPGREVQWIYSKSTPEKLPDGSVTWYGFNTDITHRKQAEEELRQSEEKFRMLIDRIPLPVTLLNKKGEVLFRNERFLQIFGYTVRDISNINDWWIRAYPDEEYRKWAINTWESAVEQAEINGPDIEAEEYRVTCKDGIEKTIIISGIIINGNFLITFIDITDRKKAEDEVRKLNETLEQRVEERTSQLREANRELESFSYSVSHDLRAPLRHINGYVDLLNTKFQTSLPEKAQHYLATVTDAANQMGTLIDDLLQFSRTGRQELRKSTIDMNVMIQESLVKIEPDLKNRKINWSIQKMPVVFGDYSLLKQVWINLLDNAVKYTKYTKSAEIGINFREENNFYVFYIRDNGVGFDMQYAQKLFGVFQRLHAQSEFEGTGIGLANVKRIVQKHHGTVWAEAEPNKGSTFYFTIPKNQEDRT